MVKITIDKAALAKLHAVALNTKANSELSGNTDVLFQLKEGRLQCRSFSGVEIVTTIDSKIPKGDYEFTVPGEFLTKLLSTPAEQVTFSLGKEKEDHSRKVTVTFGDSSVIIQGGDPHSIVRLPVFDTEDSVVIDKADLVACINGVKSIAAKADKGTYLYSVNLIIDDGYLSAIASDGRRLGFVKRKVKGNSSLKKEVLLPFECVKRLMDFLSDLEEVNLEFSSSHLKIQSGESTLSLQLLDHKFPNIKEYMTPTSQNFFIIQSSDVERCLDTVSLIEKSKFPSVDLSFDENSLRFESTSDGFKAKDVINESFGISEYKTTFNTDFLKTALSNIGANQVRVFIEQNGRFIITPSEDDGLNNVQVVMPRR